MVVVPRVTDLDAEALSERELIVWLSVVAGCNTVIAKADLQVGTTAAAPACLRHEAATRHSARRVGVATPFAEAHPRLVAALRQYAASPKSKWCVIVGDGWRAEGNVVTLTTLADFRSYLRGVRCLARARGDHGTYSRRRAGAAA